MDAKRDEAALDCACEVKSPKLRGNSGLSLDRITEFEWQVALGGEQLTLEELQALAKLKTVGPSSWPVGKIEHEEMQAALDFWKKKATGQATVRDVVRMALGAGRRRADWVRWRNCGRLDRNFLAQLDGRQRSRNSRHHNFEAHTAVQLRGFSWLGFLRRWGSVLPGRRHGAGKTVQTLALIQRDWESSGNRRCC